MSFLFGMVWTALQWIEKIAAGINEWIGRAVSWLTLVMALVTFVIIVLRKALSMGWIWMQDSVLYLHSVVFLIGAGFTLKRGGHVRVDVLYGRLGPKRRALVNLFGTVFLLMPMCWLIYDRGLPYVEASWQVRERSQEAGGLDGVYLLKTTILVYAGLLVLQGLAVVIDSLLILSGKRQADPEGEEAEL
ncbi:MAG: TRAP transporter small permease subunit [Proteobacteria bacterium]|nr:TRAP transporter small permease subunit [Pseudomonadota bacterium]